MRDSEPTRCPLTGDAATIGGSSELMAVEHHKLGSYRLEAGARDVLEANSHVRESVAAWILDLHEHRAKTPVLSVELVRFFERLVELDSMIRTWRDVGQRISANDNDRLWKKLKLEWNYNSNHIEGNTLTYHETELLLIFGRTSGGHPMRDYEEMKAHDVAIDHVRKLAEEERDLSEAEIRQLNEIILKEPFWAPAETPEGQSTRKCIIPGEYKRDPNHVRTSTGALHKFAEPADTPSLMAAWTRDFRRDMTRCAYPLPLFLAESHNGLLAIHPFGDGNGRTARLLVNFALLRRRLPPIVIKAEDRGPLHRGIGERRPRSRHATGDLHDGEHSVVARFGDSSGERREYRAREGRRQGIGGLRTPPSRRPTREERCRDPGQGVRPSGATYRRGSKRTTEAVVFVVQKAIGELYRPARSN